MCAQVRTAACTCAQPHASARRTRADVRRCKVDKYSKLLLYHICVHQRAGARRTRADVRGYEIENYFKHLLHHIMRASERMYTQKNTQPIVIVLLHSFRKPLAK